MAVLNRQLLGISIGLETISICRSDLTGDLYCDFASDFPDPPMPGAVTVAICEGIQFVDPDFKADLVGVSLYGEIKTRERILKSCTHLPGWHDVPLAEWLETRTSRRVEIISAAKCLEYAQNSQVKNNDIKNCLLSSVGAALLAYERFKDFLD